MHCDSVLPSCGCFHRAAALKFPSEMQTVSSCLTHPTLECRKSHSVADGRDGEPSEVDVKGLSVREDGLDGFQPGRTEKQLSSNLFVCLVLPLMEV